MSRLSIVILIVGLVGCTHHGATVVALPSGYEVLRDYPTTGLPHFDAGDMQSMETWELWVIPWAQPMMAEISGQTGATGSLNSGVSLNEVFMNIGVPFPDGSWIQYDASRAVLTVHNYVVNNQLLRLYIRSEDQEPGVVRIARKAQ